MGANEGMDMKKIIDRVDLALPLIITLLSILLNIICFIQIPFVPEKYHWTVSLTIHVATLNLLFKIIIIKTQKRLSEIKLIYSVNNENYIPDETTRVEFLSNTNNVFLKITVSGDPKSLLNSSIIIVFPTQVSIQKIKEYADYYEIDRKQNIVSVPLKKVFNTNLKNRLNNHSFEIGFSLSKRDRVVDSPVETRLNIDTWKIKLSSNVLFLWK